MKKWLAQLLEENYIPAIAPLKDTPVDRAQAREWADWLRGKWAEHGLTALNQQRTLMTDTRNAIKTIDSHHIALESMNFSTEQWREMNNPSEDAVEQRNENQQLLDDPDAIVAKASELLNSRDWAEVAAGIVVCTGRRSSEVLATARFEPKSNYSVTFTGQLKRKGEDVLLQFEIPTLAPAQAVIKSLAFLRREVHCHDLTNREINQKYGNPVAKACDRHFVDLVPQREGKDNLYTHLFRAVYARIAVFYYCPVRVADIVYMAAIQGHYQILEAPTAKLRRSYASTRNYFDYKISDGQGNIDGRQGIKLNQPEVQVLEIFRHSAKKIEVRETESGLNVLTPVMSTQKSSQTSNARPLSVQDVADSNNPTETGNFSPSTPVKARNSDTRVRANKSDRPRLATLATQIEAPNQQTALSFALSSAESVVELASELGVSPKPEAIVTRVRELAALATSPVSQPEPSVDTSESDPPASSLESVPPAEGKTGPESTTDPVAQSPALIPTPQAIDPITAPAFNTAWWQIAELTKAVTCLTQQLSQVLVELVVTKAQPSQSIQPQPQPATAPQAPPRSQPAVNIPQAAVPASQPVVGQTNLRSPSVRQKGSAEEKIHRWVQALMNFNDSPERTHDERWAINQTSVQRLSGSNREAVKRYLAAHAEEIAQHNAEYNLTERHNTGKGRRGLAIEQVVQLPQQPSVSIPNGISEEGVTPVAGTTAHSPLLPNQLTQSSSSALETDLAKPQSRKVSGPAEERIDRAVQAIMNYNNYTATEKDQKWAITASAVARLCGSNRPAINRYFEEHHQAIADHNAKHELSEGHNIPKGKKGQKIEDFIQL